MPALTWAYELLGVAADADATTIKRAYARLLRTTRPDEDAEAFQRLNTAYQMALMQASRHAASSSMARPAPFPSPALPKHDTHVPPASTGNIQPPAAPQHVAVQPSRPAAPLERLKPGPSIAPKTPHALEALSPPETSAPESALVPLEILKPADPVSKPARVLPPIVALRPAASRPPPPPTINIAELAKRVVDEACRAEESLVLGNWLAHCPELWSFRIKQLTGQRVMQGLAQEPRPMQPANFDALLGFFDLDNVLTGLNPVALEKLRSRLAAHWEMLNDHTALARRSRILTEKGRPHPRRVRSCISLLQQPRSWRRTIGVTLTRGKSADVARIAHVLCLGVPEQLPATLNRGHAQFWLRAVGGNGREYWTLVVTRVLAMALAGAAITAIVLFWAASQQGDIIKPAAWRGIGSISAAMFAGIALFLSILIGVRWIDHWQGASESSSEANPWRRRLLIPSLCALGLGVDYLLDKPIVATPIVLGSLALAIRRYTLRMPKRNKKPVLNLSPRVLTYLLLAGASTIGSVAAQAVNGGALDNVPLLAMTTGTTLVIWGIDMFRHRAHWWVKQAGS